MTWKVTHTVECSSTLNMMGVQVLWLLSSLASLTLLSPTHGAVRLALRHLVTGTTAGQPCLLATHACDILQFRNIHMLACGTQWIFFATMITRHVGAACMNLLDVGSSCTHVQVASLVVSLFATYAIAFLQFVQQGCQCNELLNCM
jgi:hypothetical protein